MPRYVILRHETRPSSDRASHWDVMLEHDGKLLTWAAESRPQSSATILADRLPDHRLEYLSYEGEVSNDRGSVMRWDVGEFRWIDRTKETIRVRLNGQHLKGVMSIELRSLDQRWSLIFSSSDSANLS